MRIRPFALLAILTSLGSGCGGGAGAETPPRGATIAPAKDLPSPPAPVSAAPTAAATTAPTASPASPFSVVARTAADAHLDMFAVDGAAFIRGTWTLTKIEDHGFLRDGSLGKGLPTNASFSHIEGFSGRWPDALFASVAVVNGRVGSSELYRWSGSEFRPIVAPLAPTWVYVGIWPWSESRTLALTRSYMAFNPRPAVRFTVIGGPPGKLPELTRAAPPAKPLSKYEVPCALPLDPIAFLALPSGHVFTAGRPCDDTAHLQWMVEQWAPGKAKGTVTTLDPNQSHAIPSYLDDDVPSFLALSPDDVYLLGNPKAPDQIFYHFDGSAWTPVKVPVSSVFSAVSGLPDGTLFVAARDAGQVWRRGPDGVWTALDLPISSEGKRMSPTGVWAKSAAEVWVTAGNSVLRTGAPAGPAVVWSSGEDESAAKNGESDPPIRAATPACKTVFALLYTLARTAPADFDFPETRAALKGQLGLKDATFVETEDRGRRYFGAFVPSYEAGIKLVKTVSEKVPGSAPQLLCAQPKVRRTIKIDLRTGALMK